jgi:hypothetical protein
MFSKIWVGDPGSEIWDPEKPFPDPKGQISTGSRIRNTEKMVPFAGTTPVTGISD